MSEALYASGSCRDGYILQVSAVAENNVDVLATVDSSKDKKSSVILMGNAEENDKRTVVELNNIPEYLIADGKVSVLIENVPETLATALYCLRV